MGFRTIPSVFVDFIHQTVQKMHLWETRVKFDDGQTLHFSRLLYILIIVEGVPRNTLSSSIVVRGCMTTRVKFDDGQNRQNTVSHHSTCPSSILGFYFRATLSIP